MNVQKITIMLTVIWILIMLSVAVKMISDLEEASKLIREAQKELSKARDHIRYSRSKIDSLMNSTVVYSLVLKVSKDSTWTKEIK